MFTALLRFATGIFRDGEKAGRSVYKATELVTMADGVVHLGFVTLVARFGGIACILAIVALLVWAEHGFALPRRRANRKDGAR